MADDVDMINEREARLAARDDHLHAPILIRGKKRQAETRVLAAFADRWIALGWERVELEHDGKVTLAWRGEGEPRRPGR